MNRRSFGKSALFAGVTLTAGSSSKFLHNFVASEASAASGYEVFRSQCPRNCFDACSMLTYVRNGVVKKVEADSINTYTGKSLCVKGYNYTRRIYDPDRAKYPMIQNGRKSGKWTRVTWNDALNIIAKKILDIKKRDGNTLGITAAKYSGNLSVSHWSILEGFLGSIGYTSRMVGNPCFPAGGDGVSYDFGLWNSCAPEEVAKSKYMILWGVNHAYTGHHMFKYYFQAKDNGGKLVTVDPYLSQSAAHSDLYVRVKPSTDGALALAMGKYIVENNLHDKEWLAANSLGFDKYEQYVRNEISYDWASKTTGLPVDFIKKFAKEYAETKPALIELGLGLQRRKNGGENVRTIDALAALTGNVGVSGGGINYFSFMTWGFNYHAMGAPHPDGSVGLKPGHPKGAPAGKDAQYVDRWFNMNKIAQEIIDADDPPIRMLWAAMKGVLSQDFDRNKIDKALTNPKLELIVNVDQFVTETAEYADIFLPVTNPMEEWDVTAGYMHQWMSINTQAIKPLGEAKSDFEIMTLVSKTLNSLQPGSSTFPQEYNGEEWIAKEFNDGQHELFGIKSYKDLVNKGPHKANLPAVPWADKKFMTPSGKYEFYSETAEKNGHPGLCQWVEPRKAYDKYALLSPHPVWGIHSQFQNVDWVMSLNPEPFAYINQTLAKEKGIRTGEMVRVFNKNGEVKCRAKISSTVPADSVLMYEAWFKGNKYNVENLVDDFSTNMGAWKSQMPGPAFMDQWVDIRKI